MKTRLKNLRKIRKKYRVTQKRVAEYLDISTQFYSQLERGVNELSYYNAFKIAKFFDTTPDELFKEDFRKMDDYRRQNKRD